MKRLGLLKIIRCPFVDILLPLPVAFLQDIRE
jgi:hypothetical protein